MPDEEKIMALLRDAVAEGESNGADAAMGFVALAQEEWESDPQEGRG